MAAIDISWWEYTGRHREFDRQGSVVSSPIMRNLTTGQERSYRDLPLGACWAAHPTNGYPVGADGLSIWCLTPGGPNGHYYWLIDGRAVDCTMTGDVAHRCFVRHGTVGDRLTVDKNGHTCGACGTLSTDNWHGWLRDGQLIS